MDCISLSSELPLLNSHSYDNHPSSSPYIGIIKTNLKIRFNALVLEVLYSTWKIALLMLVFLNVTFLVELAFPVIHNDLYDDIMI